MLAVAWSREEPSSTGIFRHLPASSVRGPQTSSCSPPSPPRPTRIPLLFAGHLIPVQVHGQDRRRELRHWFVIKMQQRMKKELACKEKDCRIYCGLPARLLPLAIAGIRISRTSFPGSHVPANATTTSTSKSTGVKWVFPPWSHVHVSIFSFHLQGIKYGARGCLSAFDI